MRGIAVLLALTSLTLATASAASGKGNPQGPVKKEWTCILDLGTWHCVPAGEEIAALAGRPGSLPSLNWACDTAGDPLCAGFAVSLTGPPAGTHFVGTENGIRADLYAGQPCPRDEPVPIDFDQDGTADYVFCHHYGES